MELGRLPLALDQAAAYLDRPGIPAGTTWACCAAGRRPVGARAGQRADGHDRHPVGHQPERISTEEPAAVKLLDLCAYLAPERIPLDLFTGHPDLLPAPWRGGRHEPTFDEAIAALVDYSLIRRTETGLQIHRLLQGALAHATSNPPRLRPAGPIHDHPHSHTRTCHRWGWCWAC